MSSAGDSDKFPKGWDVRELAHIKNFTNARTPNNPGGKIVMDCAYAFQGISPVVRASVVVDTSTGSFSVVKAWSGMGRPAAGGTVSAPGANYCLTVKQGGLMLGESFLELERGYTGPQYTGVEYSGITNTNQYVSIVIPVSGPVNIDLGIILEAQKDGVSVGASCTTAGPGGTLLPDVAPPSIDGCSDIMVECTAQIGTPKDDAQLGSFFSSLIAVDSCDPNPRISNDALDLFPLAITNVVFTAQDCDGNTDSCTGKVTVQDSEDPTIDGCSDIAVECSALGGTPKEDSQLSHLFSSIVAVDICDPAPGVSDNAPSLFPVGATTDVVFTAIDASDNTQSCTGSVAVQDTTAAIITIALDFITLWPPNKKYYALDIVVDFGVTGSDICCGTENVPKITSVASDEPNNDGASGRGDDSLDIYETGDTSFMVKAQRDGRGDGRIYTIGFTVTDCNLQVSSDELYVRVPANRKP
jgi:hypothetical protein